MPGVLCGQPGAAGHCSRGLLSHADGGVSGGDRLGAGHCLAVCGLVFAAGLSGIRAGGQLAGAFDPVEDAEASERGGGRGGLRFRAGAAAGVGPAARQDAGRGCDDAGGECRDTDDRTARRRDGLLTIHVLRFFRRIRLYFALPEPNVASSRRKTRFLHHNTADARLFSLPIIIRRAPISSTAC